jgi:hypothetical protein
MEAADSPKFRDISSSGTQYDIAEGNVLRDKMEGKKNYIGFILNILVKVSHQNTL